MRPEVEDAKVSSLNLQLSPKRFPGRELWLWSLLDKGLTFDIPIVD